MTSLPSDTPPFPGPLWSSVVEDPSRRANSVRRTVSIDAWRPAGAAGTLRVSALGRDLLTPRTGTATDLATARLELSIDLHDGCRILSMTAEPWWPKLDQLIGTSACSGFRRRLAAIAAGYVGHLLFALLDDVPSAALLSRAPMQESGGPGEVPTRGPGWSPPIDVCAGWVRNGWLSHNVAAGRTPSDRAMPMPDGPTEAADHLAWHSMADSPVGSVRRVRRLDVSAPLALPTVQVEIDSMFRDSLHRGDGQQVIMHEYGILAAADWPAMTTRTVHAQPRVLPGPECPLAAGSADRVIGRPLVELREFIGTELAGVSTCTHLNDALRLLGDAAALAPELV